MIIIPSPQQQINFTSVLESMRNLNLQKALFDTVASMKTTVNIDKELISYAQSSDLALLAGNGLRGEVLFATPCILEGNPHLLGYYRLILGFSKKAFYSREFGLSLAIYKNMEEKGIIGDQGVSQLPELCTALNSAASDLLNGISKGVISRMLLHELSLITLGSQFRGGTNVKIGQDGIDDVFKIIHDIVMPYITTETPKKIELKNAAERVVVIEFNSDPDIVIKEIRQDGDFTNKVAIEVKAGTDFSNVYNRIGEAEKSHRTARQNRFYECWTIINVDRTDMKKAAVKSPSTDKFYLLSDLLSQKGLYNDFKLNIVSLTGIPI
jgi:hypothetical protein